MEGEINNFMMVWVMIYVSVCYCYGVAKIIPKGTTRLITFLPVVSLFFILPLNHLHSIHLGGGTSLFISWLANFKLLMFAFDVGPLADPSLSLAHFVALACLPINFRRNPPPQPPPNFKKPLKGGPNKESPNKECPYPKISKSGLESPLNYATKSLILALLVLGYDYSMHLPPLVVRLQILLHLFVNLEIFLAISATLAQVLLQTKVEPQFNDPYFSTSLQNFWSRRWNLVVSDTVRLSIYKPIQSHSRPILGHEWSLFLALMGSYLVSGLMHELAFYQIGRLRPKWGSTMYFLIQGVCVTVEIVVKRMFIGKFQLPPVISVALTLAFVIFSFSELVVIDLQEFQIGDRLIQEYVAVGTFIKDIICLCTSNRFFN